MKNPVNFFDCECLTHHLRVAFETDPDYPVFYFSMLAGMGRTISIKTRLRIAFQMLFYGAEGYDNIILSKEEAKRLAAFLTEQKKDVVVNQDGGNK